MPRFINAVLQSESDRESESDIELMDKLNLILIPNKTFSIAYLFNLKYLHYDSKC